MPESQDFAFVLKTLPRNWRAVIDRRLAPLGLSQAKWQLLLFVFRAKKPATQTEIAAYLDVESPTIVRLLDRLADDGWIKREACPGDRRARHICLTPRAREVCAEIETVVADVRRQLLVDVSADELRQCMDVLRRVQRRTETLLQTDDPTPEISASAPAAKPTRRRRSN